jgi:hypothetical protein
MAYKSEFQYNNADLQAILDIINEIPDITSTSSTFIETNSGGNTYKSKFQDNNVDLQNLLGMVSLLTDAPKIEDILIDFVYTDNGNNTYTITDWKGTFEGVASTRCIIPEDARIIL